MLINQQTMNIKKQKHKCTRHGDKEQENDDEYMSYAHQKIIGPKTNKQESLESITWLVKELNNQRNNGTYLSNAQNKGNNLT